jgi:hypothetical protein
MYSMRENGDSIAHEFLKLLGNSPGFQKEAADSGSMADGLGRLAAAVGSDPGSQGPGQSDADSVKQAQMALGVKADGIMGPQTEAALKSWQQSNGLTADGVLGPETLQALGLGAGAGSAAQGAGGAMDAAQGAGEAAASWMNQADDGQTDYLADDKVAGLFVNPGSKKQSVNMNMLDDQIKSHAFVKSIAIVASELNRRGLVKEAHYILDSVAKDQTKDFLGNVFSTATILRKRGLEKEAHYLLDSVMKARKRAQRVPQRLAPKTANHHIVNGLNKIAHSLRSKGENFAADVVNATTLSIVTDLKKEAAKKGNISRTLLKMAREFDRSGDTFAGDMVRTTLLNLQK